jgi:hypothetical protein
VGEKAKRRIEGENEIRREKKGERGEGNKIERIKE